MNTNTDWEKIVRRMELLLRLKSFPVAFKMLEKKEELEKVPFVRRPGKKVTLCQLITLVRSFDWTVGADVDDFVFPSCPAILGLRDTPDIFKDGTFRSIVWAEKKEDARKYEASIPHLPIGKYEAVAMAPLVYNPFDPEIVLIYANPAQMILLINAIQLRDYEVMQFFCVGESSCSDAIARCYETKKPSLTIPCYGERRYGHTQDEDLVMAIPADMMEKTLDGLEVLYRRGVRYPISFAGAEGDITAAFPPSYMKLEDIAKTIRGDDNRLLLGVTGGIAGGKTTVANMFKELGAPIIDFDIIAREVVEPGKPAWKEVVDFFGKQIVQEDGTLDRKALSKIVFQDFEKRKKLESFTHPAIYEEFFKQVNEISAKQPDVIIQVVIPLLVELNLQYMFHKIMVVQISNEEQVKRLAKRDSISEEEAANMLKAQLPIDKKIGFADYIINNQGSLAETQKAVENVWDLLKKDQTALSQQDAP